MQLILPREQAHRMKALLSKAGRREIGGVLMGEQMSVGCFRIVDFSVDAQTGSAAHFVRSPEHHGSALDAFFDRTGRDYARFNYLGEWHSHPSYSTRPSLEDVHAMTDLVTGERSIDFSVLLIARLRFIGWLEASAFVFSRNSTPRPAILKRS
jgi:integrative and conjugative element protein (TIGR02256 family)